MKLIEIKEKNMSCPFCDMFKNTNKDVIDIVPLNPVVPGHRIVIPRAHVKDFSEDPQVTARVMEYASAMCNDARGNGDMNLITSKGKSATQTVFHLHVHLVPRHEGDGLTLPWTGQKK